MSAIFVIASNTFRQTVRQRLFYNVAIFGVFMLALSMVIGQLTFGHPDRVVRSVGLSGVTISLDLVALLLSVGLIHQEIDKKTLFVVLTRPVRRWQYVVGRYFGLLFTLFLTLVGLSLIFFLTLISSLGTPAASDLLALCAVLPEAAILAAIGITLSAFSTPTLSAGLGIGIWIAGTATDDLVRLTEKADAVTRAAAQAAYYILPCLARFNFRDPAIYSGVVNGTEYASMLAYGVCYAAAFVAVASMVLSRREMT